MSFFENRGARAKSRDDPPHKHWLNPAADIHGVDFCGHCGDDWPCRGYRQAVCITCGETLTGVNRMYCDQDNPARSYYP